MSRCSLCPRKCNADREHGEYGFCGVPALPTVAKACLHFGEEPPVSGTRGSGAVFFSGCSLGCVFCQNYKISRRRFGKTISIERLAEIFSRLEALGAHNINLVSPTHYADAIEAALSIYRPNIPIVYNTGGYDSVEVINRRLFDVYLFDLKYIDPEKSRRYSLAENYFEVASRALRRAYELCGPCRFAPDGTITSGVIIRHLLLPGAVNDAKRIIDFAEKSCPGATFSLMAQYTPCGESEKYPEINRKVTRREYEKAAEYLLDRSFCDVWFQERGSACGDFIPDFDLDGV